VRTLVIETERFPPDALRAIQARGELFAVLDACDAPAVPLLCEGLGSEASVSLYRGEAEEQYADLAPYLVHIGSEQLLDWVVAFSALEAWGILIVAAVPMEALRTHLRKFLKVLGPDGQRLYFRFYDPRVMEMFLPTCDGEQIEQFFGPVRAYGTMHAEQGVVAWRRTGMLPVVDREQTP